MSVRQVISGLGRAVRAQLRLADHGLYQLPRKPLQIAPRRVGGQQKPPEVVVEPRNFFQRLTHSIFSPASSLRLSTVLRNIASGPVRTVAPLLGFIAAFLQESKTEEFKLSSACAVVREEANEFSKRAVSRLPVASYDFSRLKNIRDLEFGDPLGKGCNAAVYEARFRQKHTSDIVRKYDLAVKVIFNYSMYSNADEILRHFENELIPSRLNHSNIVGVLQAVIDQIPVQNLSQCTDLFPSALPDYMPGGMARSHTMFVLMDKHSCTLKDDLEKRGKPYDFREGLLIFVQLLEAVVKLVKEKVVHRDIKSDNVLLNKEDEDGNVVRALISDFGCSLQILRLNYTSPHIPRGGNRALMAPEVINAQPGLFSVIDYSRSDIWAVGTLAYEIFTGYNPFYQGLFKLDSAKYSEECLPEVIPGKCELNRLIRAILRHDPRKRPSPAVAATACHLLLWDFPVSSSEPPSLESIHEWIEELCVRLFCGSRNDPTQFAILSTFLKRCKLNEIMEAWKVLSGC